LQQIHDASMVARAIGNPSAMARWTQLLAMRTSLDSGDDLHVLSFQRVVVPLLEIITQPNFLVSSDPPVFHAR
jgi:hypothetical protein